MKKFRLKTHEYLLDMNSTSRALSVHSGKSFSEDSPKTRSAEIKCRKVFLQRRPLIIDDKHGVSLCFCLTSMQEKKKKNIFESALKGLVDANVLHFQPDTRVSDKKN